MLCKTCKFTTSSELVLGGLSGSINFTTRGADPDRGFGYLFVWEVAGSGTEFNFYFQLSILIFHVNQIIPRINTKGKLLGIPRKIRLAFFQTNNIVQPNVLLMFQCLRFFIFFSIYTSPSNTVYTVLPVRFGFFGFENLKMRNRMN